MVTGDTPAGDDRDIFESLDAADSVLKINRSELTEIYRLFVDEYRFQTRFNWDRVQYFFVLNSAILAVGATLLKEPSISRVKPLLGFLFLLGFSTATFAVKVARKGDEYYRRAVLKKTIAEKLLRRFDRLPGFTEQLNLSLGTTGGMSKPDEILRAPEVYVRQVERSETIKYAAISLLRLFAVINAIGYLYSVLPESLFESAIAKLARLLG